MEQQHIFDSLSSVSQPRGAKRTRGLGADDIENDEASASASISLPPPKLQTPTPAPSSASDSSVAAALMKAKEVAARLAAKKGRVTIVTAPLPASEPAPVPPVQPEPPLPVVSTSADAEPSRIGAESDTTAAAAAPPPPPSDQPPLPPPPPWASMNASQESSQEPQSIPIPQEPAPPSPPVSFNSGSKINDMIKVPNDVVGLVIGKSGERIKDLIRRSKCRIQLIKEPSGDPNNKEFTMYGTMDEIKEGKRLIQELVDIVYLARHQGTDPLLPPIGGPDADLPGYVEERVLCPSFTVGYVVGHKGDTVKNLCEQSGALIQAPRYPPGSVRPQKSEIMISGKQKYVDYAKELVMQYVSTAYSREMQRRGVMNPPHWSEWSEEAERECLNNPTPLPMPTIPIPPSAHAQSQGQGAAAQQMSMPYQMPYMPFMPYGMMGYMGMNMGMGMGMNNVANMPMGQVQGQGQGPLPPPPPAPDAGDDHPNPPLPPPPPAQETQDDGHGDE